MRGARSLPAPQHPPQGWTTATAATRRAPNGPSACLTSSCPLLLCRHLSWVAQAPASLLSAPATRRRCSCVPTSWNTSLLAQRRPAQGPHCRSHCLCPRRHPHSKTPAASNSGSGSSCRSPQLLCFSRRGAWSCWRSPPQIRSGFHSHLHSGVAPHCRSNPTYVGMARAACHRGAGVMHIGGLAAACRQHGRC